MQASGVEIVASVVVGLFFVALLYFVVRWGVRDGMIDQERWKREHDDRTNRP